jgi:hypothetical protein
MVVAECRESPDATLAAENGPTEAQLMAIFGWKAPKQAAHYTRTMRQKNLARAAMHLIELDENANETVPRLPGVMLGRGPINSHPDSCSREFDEGEVGSRSRRP